VRRQDEVEEGEAEEVEFRTYLARSRRRKAGRRGGCWDLPATHHHHLFILFLLRRFFFFFSAWFDVDESERWDGHVASP
jgi:hypothetical protein